MSNTSGLPLGEFACHGTRHHGGDNAACDRHIAKNVN